MRNRRRTWFLRRLVLGLAVAAVAVPVAQARPDEGVAPQSGSVALGHDDKVIVSSPTQAFGHDDKVIVSSPTQALGHDDKVIVTSPTGLEPTVGAEYNQFTYRRALPQDYGNEPVQIVSRPDGFDWSDAGIGAGLAFALMLLAAGATVATRQMGRAASV